ncbi:hypothetical protein [Algisphaera agarilytica]|uniref:Uncharacterized protein n=1 Tax=Algisphaera agarilytica TaxID=1385975 RepID=A0A7X0H6I4_9BACT|nr:hypothetical protein [Algisphaera agarilytica]MBB6428725.1 hypothetical protein [Algisphaera agarilytica]
MVSSSWDSLRELADPPTEQGKDGRRVRGQAFAVELQTLEGTDRLQLAYDYANVVRTQAQIADVWFVDRGQDAVVYAGRYPRKDHPEARAKLKEVRAATVEGKRVFRKAKLVAIDRKQAGIRDKHDLSQYSGYRTLLVAVFDENHGKEFRRSAEETAEALREEHEVDIYFYHGPNQSLVTAGLFTQMDFVPVDGVDSYGPEIRQMQEIFPHTQRNGEYLIGEDLASEDKREPTVVVRVP